MYAYPSTTLRVRHRLRVRFSCIQGVMIVTGAGLLLWGQYVYAKGWGLC